MTITETCRAKTAWATKGACWTQKDQGEGED